MQGPQANCAYLRAQLPSDEGNVVTPETSSRGLSVELTFKFQVNTSKLKPILGADNCSYLHMSLSLAAASARPQSITRLTADLLATEEDFEHESLAMG